MKKEILILIFTITAIYSCKKEKENKEQLKCSVSAVAGVENNIVGKWKLVKGTTVFYNPDAVDYSCNEIIYEFKQDDTLTVNSNGQSNIGFEDEEYNYELISTPLQDNINEKYTLKIGELNCAVDISSRDMTINNSYLDGPILYFLRIQ